jgi:hypothetical protein
MQVEMAGKLSIEDYSEKSIVLRGDTYHYREVLKGMGGKYNNRLKQGAKTGWIFSKKRRGEVSKWLTSLGKAGGAAESSKKGGSRSLRPKKKGQEEADGKRPRRAAAQRAGHHKMQWSDEDEGDGGDEESDEEWDEVEEDEEEEDDSGVTDEDDDYVMADQRAKPDKRKRGAAGKGKGRRSDAEGTCENGGPIYGTMSLSTLYQPSDMPNMFSNS